MPFLPTVLVVDDEIRSQKALRRTLEEDFGVFTASSLAEARTVMEREDAQIVLTDQRMLEVSGVAFLKGVRETWPDTVRIIISGYTQTNQMDVIRAILMLLRQVNEGRAEVENGFIRAITPSGNRKAQALMDQVFEVRDRFEWRGLGECKLFGTVCTPEAPMDPCMVSSEGACTAHYTYGRHKDAQASMA